jgi:8-oxo-dGTP pyrophosphatase MutT (NUDIX family)
MCYTGRMHTVRLVACVIVRDIHSRILLGVRGPGPGAGLRGLPGGHCDPGESPRACAVRELTEETSLRAHPDALTFALVSGRPGFPSPDVTHVEFIFETRRVTGTPRDTPEMHTWTWVSPAALPPPELMFAPAREVLTAWLRGERCAWRTGPDPARTLNPEHQFDTRPGDIPPDPFLTGKLPPVSPS